MHFSPILLAGLSHLVVSASGSCLHNTPLMPRQTTPNGVAVAQFGYTGLQGPAHWHKLNPNNTKACLLPQSPDSIAYTTQCATGDFQSPIDVIPAKLTYLQGAAGPQLNYPPIKSATFENLGSTVEVLVTSGSLVYNSTTYSLKQFHFHTPSEHRINGEAFPLEMHLVHASPTNAIAVIGQVFELSAHSSTALLDEVFAHLAAITEPGSVTRTGRFNFNKVMENVAKNGVYTYGGSLTTPPCSEGVTWFVAKEPLPIDVDSYEKMKHVVKFNQRFTQGDLGAPNVLSPQEVV
ncbi:MAG: hypothetical protein HETSPECPRED_005686 [Heterodermia speciosa]|uniref:Carbonic anhydrase n=1 Tax=Heterodermia speciosa TaxID=116794 RepID=A0A8H3FHV0_9LECA|nr:MAG: hypothetical protein HETSPECPRED_005686 [Heterodermia speciosa]